MTTTTRGPAAARRTGKLPAAIRARPTLTFFLLTFGLAWAYELVGIFVLRLPLVPWMFGAPFIGPTLAAFVVTAIADGRSGVADLLRSYVRWRVGLGWYLVVILGLPAVLLLCALPLPGALQAATLPTVATAATYAVNFVPTLLLGGPLSEEPGWRSFALPRMQARLGPTGGTLLLGCLWALWHLPLYLVEGYNHAGATLAGIVVPYLAFFAFTVSISVPFTWIFNHTNGSALLAILLHAFCNATLLPVFFPGIPDSLRYEIIQAVVFPAIAIVLIVATRGRLGSKPDRLTA